MGDTASFGHLRDEHGQRRHDPFTTDEPWFDSGQTKSDIFKFEVGKRKYYLADSIAAALRRISEDSTGVKQLELGKELVKYHEGPPKALARALEKGPRYLLDLNRFTIQVDSPAIMVLTFLLLQKLIEDNGGRITRFDNYHLHLDSKQFQHLGGVLNTEMDRPPCLHLNFVLDDWSFEGMFIFSDFLALKHRLHKFYDISRSKHFYSALAPVFPVGDVELVPSSPKGKPSSSTRLQLGVNADNEEDANGQERTEVNSKMASELRKEQAEGTNNEATQEHTEAELRKMRVGKLVALATEAEFPQDQIDEAEDAENPKTALIELLLAKARPAQGSAIKAIAQQRNASAS